tara:strand:- start:5204 stop:5614 length:411 start_codon:yes stop_codon:yes gene_type:complete
MIVRINNNRYCLGKTEAREQRELNTHLITPGASAADPLEIPAFLKRTGPAPKVRKQRRTRQRWNMPKLPFATRPPKAKAWKGATRATVILGDECPRIGSGQRHVWAKRGRKWVLLCDSLGNRGKLRIADFDRFLRA